MGEIVWVHFTHAEVCISGKPQKADQLSSSMFGAIYQILSLVCMEGKLSQI